MNWQPTLIGALIRLRPLAEDDFESLHSAASDPLIWEQHPERDRYRRENFMRYFRSGIESKGALAVIDQTTGQLIGSSRFIDYNPEQRSAEVGYTFLSRSYWGKGHNREQKFLMLNHAFQFVDTVRFVIGETNFRSQKAVLGIGATKVDRTSTPLSVVFQLTKADWAARAATVAPRFEQPTLETPRLILDPVVESHAQDLWDLFRDTELHTFVPFEPQSLEKQRECCARWEKRRSPDGSELWLNWIGRDRSTDNPIAHFQAGVKSSGDASIGYLVAREFQGKGIATEGLKAVLAYLRDGLGVRQVKAWADTRNNASHRLAQKLGMVQVDFIKDADFFKGASSDEFVFSKVFES